LREELHWQEWEIGREVQLSMLGNSSNCVYGAHLAGDRVGRGAAPGMLGSAENVSSQVCRRTSWRTPRAPFWMLGRLPKPPNNYRRSGQRTSCVVQPAEPVPHRPMILAIVARYQAEQADSGPIVAGLKEHGQHALTQIFVIIGRVSTQDAFGHGQPFPRQGFDEWQIEHALLEQLVKSLL